MIAPERLPQPPFASLRLPAIVPWLVAVASIAALGVVIASGPIVRHAPARPPVPTPVHHGAVLPVHAAAADVSRAFGKMTPYQVQKDMGESRGKVADCSVYSDGNLDDGSRVTWAVTLCVVHKVAHTATTSG